MTELALPGDYASVLLGLTERVRQSRYRAQRTVNTELIGLYWLFPDEGVGRPGASVRR